MREEVEHLSWSLNFVKILILRTALWRTFDNVEKAAFGRNLLKLVWEGRTRCMQCNVENLADTAFAVGPRRSMPYWSLHEFLLHLGRRLSQLWRLFFECWLGEKELLFIVMIVQKIHWTGKMQGFGTLKHVMYIVIILWYEGWYHGSVFWKALIRKVISAFWEVDVHLLYFLPIHGISLCVRLRFVCLVVATV